MKSSSSEGLAGYIGFDLSIPKALSLPLSISLPMLSPTLSYSPPANYLINSSQEKIAMVLEATKLTDYAVCGKYGSGMKGEFFMSMNMHGTLGLAISNNEDIGINLSFLLSSHSNLNGYI
jgi:hypothetical protein